MSPLRRATHFNEQQIADSRAASGGATPALLNGRVGQARLSQCSGNPDPDDLVFPGKDGGYLDASALRRRYVTAQEKAGLRKLRFHDLRHVFGSTAINRASIIQVQAWLGHADVKTTMRYLHHKSHTAEADLLDGAFGAGQPLVPVTAEAA